MADRGVSSVASGAKYPLEPSAPTSPFLFGDTSPVFTCKPGYSTKVDDFKGVHTPWDGRASGFTSFHPACGADGEVNVVGGCKPLSCKAPTFVQNSVVDNEEFVVPERPQVLCRAAPPSQALPWPLISLHQLLFCRPVSCRVHDDVNGTASPPDQRSNPSSTIVTCDTGHTNGRSAWRLDLFGFMWFGRKLVVHFCVVCTDIF